MVNGNDEPTADGPSDENESFSRRRLLQFAGIGLTGAAAAATKVNAQESPDRLEILASGQAVDYSFTCSGRIEPIQGDGLTSTESDQESVVENDDGTWTATGRVEKHYGDAFAIEGDVHSLEPADGTQRLYLNGDRISHDDLVQPPVERENSYSFEGVGDSWADYYLEVEEGGDMLASTKDGAVIEPEFHWISEDGTKAAGRVDPGERHAYEFDNLVLDVTIEGEADAYVNGRDSSVDRYPLSGATGDGWKGGFPWQTVDVERENSYSFEGVGDSWADYYLEVEEGGDMLASTKDGAVIEPEFHWISEDGTKAAGRVDPGERHAYEFDNLVLDVTIEGEADAYVNGRDSSVDRYPLSGATGDGWKGGFPWQDEEAEPTTDGLALGGGPGYGDIVTESDADEVVQTASGLDDALSGASAGDVVFVDGNASIDTGSAEFSVPDGVTVASNRGSDGSSGGMLYTNDEPDAILHMNGDDARVTGLRIRGSHPDSDVSVWDGISYSNEVNSGVRISSSGAEVDNCEIYGNVYAGVYVESGDGSTHVHHNYIYQNNTQGLGYGVSVGYDSSADPLIEYNYLDENRHSVTSTGDNYGYTARYNHIGPTTVLHPIDIHDPGSQDTTIENNIVEPLIRTWDDNCAHAIDGFDGTEGVVRIQGNWFWNDTCTFDVPTSDSDVEVSDNHYGEDAASFAAVIPDHPGAAHRPWD